jgi:hypothetical protein
MGGRLVWGNTVSKPEAAVVAMAFGSKNSRLNKALHCVARSTSAGTSGVCTALKCVQQGSQTPKLILGSGDGSGYQLDKYSSTATFDSLWRSKLITVGAEFRIDRIRLPLGAALAANQSLTVKIVYDDGASTRTLTAINTTNFTSGTRKIIYNQQEIMDAAITPQNNFYLQLEWAGTVALPVMFPIEIILDIAQDEAND